MICGCNMMNRLWQVALTCNPGIIGVLGHVINFVECENIRDFMVISTT
jgi:hypothetical protein